MTVFRNLIRKAVSDKTLVVVFSPNKEPRYIPKHQSPRMDKKAIIEMPCPTHRTIDDTETDVEIDKVLSNVTLVDALILFSHEYGHHLTDNPGYDAALMNCLRLPVKQRTTDDKDLVIKEETEAWSLGFSQLKVLGFQVPASALQLAREKVEEYRVGVTATEPIN